MGAVHAWLRSNAQEWAVLRPSWFMQNFSENQHLGPIRDESAIYTATQDGRAAFIDAEDIAACVATLLIASKIENTDHIITGPEAVSYDEVARTLSQHLGREIIHRKLDIEGLAERFRNLGLPDDYATALAGMDVGVAQGSEDRLAEQVHVITGRKPTSIDAFVLRNIGVWRR